MKNIVYSDIFTYFQTHIKRIARDTTGGQFIRPVLLKPAADAEVGSWASAEGMALFLRAFRAFLNHLVRNETIRPEYIYF